MRDGEYGVTCTFRCCGKRSVHSVAYLKSGKYGFECGACGTWVKYQRADLDLLEKQRGPDATGELTLAPVKGVAI